MESRRFILEGSIAGALFRLGWPVMLSFLVYSGFTLVDAIFIGRLGPSALAASGPAQFASWLLIAVGEVIGVGTAAVIARRVGAGESGEAGRMVAQGGILVLLAGAGALITAGPAAHYLFLLIGTDPEVSRLGYAYLSILFRGAIFSFSSLFMESALRAAGDTRTPMFITGGGFLLNALLDPLLIFGAGPVPALGIEGAAIATVISQATMVCFFLAHFRSDRTAVPIDFRAARVPDLAVWGKIIRIGAPVSMITALFSAVYLFLTYFLAKYGAVPIAVVGVGNRLEGITYLIAHGLSVAAMTLVGQNLGAGKSDRAEKAAWMASGIAAGMALLIGLAFFLFPRWIFGFFTDDPTVLEEGVRFLRIVALCQGFMGVEVVMYGAFSGAGDTLPATIISTFLNALRIPAAWIVADLLGYGPVGIWWMISLSCIVRGVLLGAWFRRNRWKEKVV